MLKNIPQLFSQRGQGVVEYALILGFVAILAAYLIGGSGLADSLKKNIDDMISVLDASRLSDD